MSGLLILGFTLSLDNFRTAVALGGLRLRWRQAGQVALAFGFWDAVAPLVGILAGHYIGQALGATAQYAGAIALGTYGLYLLARAVRAPASAELDSVRVLFGLPLPLSLDNVVAGASLGLVGVSPWLTAPLFGAITALMSLVGLALGRALSHLIRIRPDVLTGVALVVMATLLGLGTAG